MTSRDIMDRESPCVDRMGHPLLCLGGGVPCLERVERFSISYGLSDSLSVFGEWVLVLAG